MEFEKTTRERILIAGKREFLEKGFRAASLRHIVKLANVTTGAFYGYFENKEALFCALVDNAAKKLTSVFQKTLEAFEQLPPNDQKNHMVEIAGQCMDWMVDYVYEQFDSFKLIVCCAEGTQYEQYIHNLVELEIEATHRFTTVLRGLGKHTREIDPQLEHILVSGFFPSFFEMVAHDMPQEQAVEYIRELRAFYTAGWREMLGF